MPSSGISAAPGKRGRWPVPARHERVVDRARRVTAGGAVAARDEEVETAADTAELNARRRGGDVARARAVRGPVVVGLGDDRDDALHLVVQPIAGPGDDQEPVVLRVRRDVFGDDRLGQPRRHLPRLAGDGDPPGRRRLRVEARRLPDAPAYLGDHRAIGRRAPLGHRGPEGAVRPPVRRAAMQGEIAEALPHGAPVRPPVVSPHEGRRGHRHRVHRHLPAPRLSCRCCSSRCRAGSSAHSTPS